LGFTCYTDLSDATQYRDAGPLTPTPHPDTKRCGVYADSGPSPIGHGPIELDSNIWIWLQRTPVAVAVVSLAVMCSYGPDKLLGAFE
jgi:hypothetical protein